MSAPPVLEPLAAWGAQIGDAWNDNARALARTALCDTLACMAAGAADAAGRRAATLAGDGKCVVIAHRARATPEIAGLINGVAAHALDYDDNFSPARIHASAVLFPALLALGEFEDARLGDIIDGFIVGLEIVGRIGELVNPLHRNRGWHATATLGAIGASAACARLLKLTETDFRNALSLSTSRASGSMIQFGRNAKPIHAGFAAEAGVTVARLARAGATAAPEAISGPKGFADLMHGGEISAIKSTDIGCPLLIETAGLKAKRFPNCASAHRSMDALLMLMNRHDFAGAEVASVEVELPAPQLANLMYPAPDISAQARFSLNYALAVILARGAPGLEDFSDDAVTDERVRQFFPLVVAHPVDTTEIDYPTRVTVTLKDGRRFSEAVRHALGSLKNPLDREALVLKAKSCFQHSALSERADELIAGWDFDDAKPVREFLKDYALP